jgi:dTDP-4-dehydrorhamnose 3,5-epimerase
MCIPLSKLAPSNAEARRLNFMPTPLAGAFVIDLKRLEDDRGFFARSFCREEFIQNGLNPEVAQCNISFNPSRGTLRGMHYQADPHAEAKLVRCTQGAIWDVIVDLRPSSPGYKQWFGTELSAATRRAIYVPQGFAHGFQTLTDDAEVLYMMAEFYHPESARGVRWDDPAFGIEWPIANPSMSDRDRSFALLAG